MITNNITGQFIRQGPLPRQQPMPVHPHNNSAVKMDTNSLLKILPEVGLNISTNSGYTIYNLIGQGGMGQVHRGVDAKGELCAIKSAFPWMEATLKKEGMMGAVTAGHPNLLSVIDIVRHTEEIKEKRAGGKEEVRTEEKTDLVVYELLKGKDLCQIMEKGDKFSPPMAIKIIREVASALQYLHELGVVHRDVKMSNVVVEIENNEASGQRLKSTKLIDFGLMEVMDETEGGEAGTTGNQSPEQIRKKGLDGRSDIFALGIMYFQMLTGRNPFIEVVRSEEKTSQEDKIKERTELNTMHDDPPAELLAMIPADLRGVITKMLAKDRNDRFQSCNEVIAALDKVVK